MVQAAAKGMKCVYVSMIAVLHLAQQEAKTKLINSLSRKVFSQVK